MTRGVVYAATGNKYIQEALRSAKSVKNQHSELSITLFADEDVKSEVLDECRVLPDPAYDYGDSIVRPNNVEYGRILFLDSDTYVVGDLSPLFSILDKFDIAVAQNPLRRSELSTLTYSYESDGIPDTFPMYNTGVMAYRNSNAVNELFQKWQNEYDDNRTDDGFNFNQPAFRELLYHSDLRIATLPSEFNCRFTRGGFLSGEVVIIHGPYGTMNDLETIEKRVNKSSNRRVHFPKKHPVSVQDATPSWRYSFQQSVKKNGLSDTIFLITNRIVDKLF